MVIDISKIDKEQFRIDSYELNGEFVYLIQPQQISCKWTQSNKHLRSSLWNSNGELISAGMPKFTNFGENPDNFPVPDSLKNATAVEKVDGCCEENTLITTENGEKTIKEICEFKYKGKILGFNHDKQKECWTSINSYSIQDNNDNWYELILEDGSFIKLTGNHQVYLPKLQCYRRVDELIGNEEILLKK